MSRTRLGVDALLREVAEWFAPGGHLSAHLEGISPRPAQADMAQAVAQAIGDRSALIVEAGTGTGKTFAYLLPALLSGQKVLVSTGTKNLQDQLFQKDLPRVRQALGQGVRVALLKGRENYLSLARLSEAELNPELKTPLFQEQLALIREWAGRTRTGDISELEAVPEDAEIWRFVVARIQDELADDDFLSLAREAAREADLVIVNHYLLCADINLRQGGFGELLPECDVYIFDEAHQLPEAGSQFFGLGVTTRQCEELAGDVRKARIGEAPEAWDMEEAAKSWLALLRDLRLAFPEVDENRGAWGQVSHHAPLITAVEAATDGLSALKQAIEPHKSRGKELTKLFKRVEDLQAAWLQVTLKPPADSIHWFELYARGFKLHITPLEVDGVFRAYMNSLDASWIFCSATLMVNGSADHFARKMGLWQPKVASWPSPFDYARQGLLYFPPGLPEPNHPDYTLKMLRRAWAVLQASRGRAFVLFTSYRALRQAQEIFRDHLEFPLFVQGEKPKHLLLEAFRRSAQGVLLATSSFWEGVDVRGEALSCVIIDKLPFGSPGDPIYQARMTHLKEQGKNAFALMQLPDAVIALKQGAGRLIRHEEDRGVLVICDPRLHQKSYGAMFINSLPPMPHTFDLADVQAFFANDGEKEDA